MEAFHTLTSHVVPLDRRDVDTDQIIPARYLKTTTKEGLGAHLFEDWRNHSDGTPNTEFILNHPEVQGARILLTGSNFGCGSSREHAPWALQDWGFRAMISTSFADIFRNNSLKIGLLPVVIDETAHLELFRAIRQDPSLAVTVDLEAQSVVFGNGHRAGFDIDPFAKVCLMEGVDQLGYLLSKEEAITKFEVNHDHPNL